jgi:hypothetical protein
MEEVIIFDSLVNEIMHLVTWKHHFIHFYM